MNLKINGEQEVIEAESLTVSELLAKKDVKMPDMVSVELNGDILDRDGYSTTQLSENDEVEFLYFMGGGAK
jgi:sulfur carrier protein